MSLKQRLTGTFDLSRKVATYLDVLEEGDYKKIKKLFARKAIVVSPLYGKQSAKKFYKELFKDTNDSTIQCINIFYGLKSLSAAALFRYDWILKNGKEVSFLCTDVFEFTPAGKIKKLTIIYDTKQTKKQFKKLKKK